MCHRLARSLLLAARKLVTVNKIAVRILTRGSGSRLLPSISAARLSLAPHCASQPLCCSPLSLLSLGVAKLVWFYFFFYMYSRSAAQPSCPSADPSGRALSLPHWPRPESSTPTHFPRWPWNKEPGPVGQRGAVQGAADRSIICPLSLKSPRTCSA